MLRDISIYIILLLTIMIGGLGGCGGGGGGNDSSQIATKSVTLAWEAPTAYSDQTPLNPLTDISTYKIYYGSASGTYTNVVNVPNPGTTSITATLSLIPGTYYFVTSDVDTLGRESNYSNEISTTL